MKKIKEMNQIGPRILSAACKFDIKMVKKVK